MEEIQHLYTNDIYIFDYFKKKVYVKDKSLNGSFEIIKNKYSIQWENNENIIYYWKLGDFLLEDNILVYISNSDKELFEIEIYECYLLLKYKKDKIGYYTFYKNYLQISWIDIDEKDFLSIYQINKDNIHQNQLSYVSVSPLYSVKMDANNNFTYLKWTIHEYIHSSMEDDHYLDIPKHMNNKKNIERINIDNHICYVNYINSTLIQNDNNTILISNVQIYYPILILSINNIYHLIEKSYFKYKYTFHHIDWNDECFLFKNTIFRKSNFLEGGMYQMNEMNQDSKDHKIYIKWDKWEKEEIYIWNKKEEIYTLIKNDEIEIIHPSWRDKIFIESGNSFYRKNNINETGIWDKNKDIIHWTYWESEIYYFLFEEHISNGILYHSDFISKVYVSDSNDIYYLNHLNSCIYDKNKVKITSFISHDNIIQWGNYSYYYVLYHHNLKSIYILYENKTYLFYLWNNGLYDTLSLSCDTLSKENYQINNYKIISTFPLILEKEGIFKRYCRGEGLNHWIPENEYPLQKEIRLYDENKFKSFTLDLEKNKVDLYSCLYQKPYLYLKMDSGDVDSGDVDSGDVDSSVEDSSVVDFVDNNKKIQKIQKIQTIQKIHRIHRIQIYYEYLTDIFIKEDEIPMEKYIDEEYKNIYSYFKMKSFERFEYWFNIGRYKNELCSYQDFEFKYNIPISKIKNNLVSFLENDRFYVSYHEFDTIIPKNTSSINIYILLFVDITKHNFNLNYFKNNMEHIHNDFVHFHFIYDNEFHINKEDILEIKILYPNSYITKSTNKNRYEIVQYYILPDTLFYFKDMNTHMDSKFEWNQMSKLKDRNEYVWICKNIFINYISLIKTKLDFVFFCITYYIIQYQKWNYFNKTEGCILPNHYHAYFPYFSKCMIRF